MILHLLEEKWEELMIKLLLLCLPSTVLLIFYRLSSTCLHTFTELPSIRLFRSLVGSAVLHFMSLKHFPTF